MREMKLSDARGRGYICGCGENEEREEGGRERGRRVDDGRERALSRVVGAALARPMDGPSDRQAGRPRSIWHELKQIRDASRIDTGPI